MIEAKGNFIIYDKQGPLGNVIRHSLKKTKITVYRYKRMSRIADFIRLRPKVNVLFILFVFNEEYELVDCMELAKLNVPIVFAPTNKNSYKNLCRVKGIEIMDVSTSKIEYVSQVINFLKLELHN